MTLLSQSRAAAADTRYRINYPNSRPRALKLVALGEGGARIAKHVGDHRLQHVQVLVVERPSADARGRQSGDTHSLSSMVQAIAAEGHRLAEALAQADMIFIVATPTDDLGVAAEIGQLGRQRNILITGILVLEPDGLAGKADAALELMRAATDMLVIVSDAGYVVEMLNELGAQPAPK